MDTKTIKVETWLPLFPGFYNTLYEMDTDRVLYDYNEDDDWHHEERKEKGYTLEQEIDYDDLEIENSNYENAVAKSFTELIEKELKKYVKKITFQAVSSPREYNYYNDSINIEVEIDIEAIQKYFEDSMIQSQFLDSLKAIYTSRDGFISFHSNNVDIWLQDINNLPNIDKIEHKIGSILDFIICNEIDMDELEIHEKVMEDISESEFCSLQEKEID